MRPISYFILFISALLNGFLGLGVSFFPIWFSNQFGIEISNSFQQLPLKCMGAGLFGFAILNFMSRRSRIGGIYQKPLVLSNTIVHLIIGGQILRTTFSLSMNDWEFVVTGIVYVLLAIGFAYLSFSMPVSEKEM